MSETSRGRRVVAVIQARMGSTRFPGKVLQPVAGKPLLWHIVHRLEKAKSLDKIVIATSENPRDDAIVEFGKKNGVAVTRGSEQDVLARFAKAVAECNAAIVVRVCSDSPFIEGGYIDHLVAAMVEQDGDYVSSADGTPNAHQGIDVFTRRALDKLIADAGDDPVAHEHVTGYFKLHPDFVPIARAKPFPDSGRADPRVSIDTPDDLAFVEAVYDRLHARAGEASLGDLLLLLEREPGLRKINAHVRQKEIAQMGALALIRCDGGGMYGFGHVKRCIELARALRDREGCGAMFAVNGEAAALTPIRRAGFEAVLLPSPKTPLDQVCEHPDFCILDCRDGPSREELKSFLAHVPVSAVIDDASERRLAADFAYFPPVPQAYRLNWRDTHCQVRIGWQWSLLGLPQTAIKPRGGGGRGNLLVTMGGSDPFGLTLRAARALSTLDPVFRARFVIGPGFKDRGRLAREIASMRANFETIEGADDLMTEYASADLALVAFGVTAFELAAFGVPAIYLSISPDHATSAASFEAAGIGQSLGLADNLTDADIAAAVAALLNDRQRRHDMHAAGLMNVDGHAATRIAGELVQALAEKRKTASGQTVRTG
jgi:spore coat polysaccharide biosynthesis protein SpsF